MLISDEGHEILELKITKFKISKTSRKIRNHC